MLVLVIVIKCYKVLVFANKCYYFVSVDKCQPCVITVRHYAPHKLQLTKASRSPL